MLKNMLLKEIKGCIGWKMLQFVLFSYSVYSFADIESLAEITAVIERKLVSTLKSIPVI